MTGGPTNDFYSGSCATTGEDQYTAWWMLAFTGNTIYFTNVKIFYRGISKCISIHLQQIVSDDLLLPNVGYILSNLPTSKQVGCCFFLIV